MVAVISLLFIGLLTALLPFIDGRLDDIVPIRTTRGAVYAHPDRHQMVYQRLQHILLVRGAAHRAEAPATA